MAFVTTIDQFRQCVPTLYATSIKNLPDTSSAEERMLLPILGQGLFDMLQAGEGLSETALKLLELCRKVICPWALLEVVDLLQVSFSDNGLIALETDNARKAYKWESNAAKDALIDRAYRAQESLINLLQKESASFPEWEQSDYRKTSFPLIRTGAELREQVYVDQPHRSYMILKPLIEEVADLELSTALGEAFLADLLGKTKAGTLSADEKDLVKLLRKASARFAMAKAAKVMNVRYMPGAGFVVTQSPKDTTLEGTKTATAADTASFLREAELSGTAYLNKAIELLNAKASSEIFPIWKNSDKYANPHQPNLNLNNDRNGFFAL